MLKAPRGFTLIELLLVIAIIGLLSSIVLDSLNAARAKADDAQRVSDLRQMQQAVEGYITNNGTYPSTCSGGATTCVAGNASWNSQCAVGGSKTGPNVAPGLVPTFIPTLPADPQMNAAGNTCCYLYKSDGADYKVMVGYSCSTANFTNPQLTTLLDPERTSAPKDWTVFSGPPQTSVQCAAGSTFPACW